MSDSHSFKPSSRPGTSPPPAKAAGQKREVPGADLASKTGSSRAGRVVHDDRGNAVWDWVKDTARIAIDSTSRLLKKLEVPELKLEDTQKELRIESDRDAGGGYDPYGQGPAHRGRAPTMDGGPGNRSRDGTTYGRDSASFANSSTARVGFGGSSNTRSSPVKDPGGGYDPYGKGITRKPTR